MRTAAPRIESLETRVVPSSLPLHVDGNRLLNSLNQPAVLRGVNVAGLEWRPDGNHTLTAVDTAVVDWHANLIRLPINEDFWFGVNAIARWVSNPDDPGGANYRALVDSVIAEASRLNAYVMLDLHWSNMDAGASNDNQHDMPDQHSISFWQSAAARYADHPAVLFDPYNEPHFDEPQPAGDWSTWRDGGTVHEAGTTYDSPGIQGLINTIRAAGAHNVIAPEGLGWGVDLSGINAGYALSDPTGNLMYQLHLYPSAAFDDDARDNLVAAVGDKTPVYIGEWGGTHNGGGAGSVADPASWNQTMIAWLNRHAYHWTAWNMWAVTDQTEGGELPRFDLITDWNTLAPTSDFGSIVKAGLAPDSPPDASPTIAVPPKATDAVVTGTSTTLSVLGADDQGESNLTYTWSIVGSPPASVDFGANGDNAAKSTSVVFAKAGAYDFQVTIRDAAGHSTVGSISIMVRYMLMRLIVSPQVSRMVLGTRRQFSAGGLDQFGDAMPLPTGPRWSASAGTISRSGLYTAPTKTGPATVNATLGTLSAGMNFAVVSNKPSASVTFRNTNDWGTGFSALITLTNTGGVDINGWTLRFDFGGSILGPISNASLIGRSGKHYVLRNIGAGAVLGVGQSVTLGFDASTKGRHLPPTNFTLNGMPLKLA